MIAMKQALEAQEFHYEPCTRTVGPRGGVRISQAVWRRNGATQTWKTRPEHFRIPVKYGMYDFGQIWHYDATSYHAAEDCPLP